MAEQDENEVIEEQEEECPKCPPVGAPAWMATFADMDGYLCRYGDLVDGLFRSDLVICRI